MITNSQQEMTVEQVQIVLKELKDQSGLASRQAACHNISSWDADRYKAKSVAFKLASEDYERKLKILLHKQGGVV